MTSLTARDVQVMMQPQARGHPSCGHAAILCQYAWMHSSLAPFLERCVPIMMLADQLRLLISSFHVSLVGGCH